VLRITWIELEGSASNRTLKLEGKLVGPWVDELSRACEELRIPPHRLRLDLADVTLVEPPRGEAPRRPGAAGGDDRVLLGIHRRPAERQAEVSRVSAYETA
jgi:hypothetical protein